MTFLGGLQLLFIALKLMGVLPWSWWWVLSPFWAICLLTVGMVALAEHVSRRDRRVEALRLHARELFDQVLP